MSKFEPLNGGRRKKKGSTPLCNRPSGTFILVGFSGIKSLGWSISHWVCYKVVYYLFLFQTEGREEERRKQGQSQDFFRGTHSFLNPPPLSNPPSNLEAIALYLLYH